MNPARGLLLALALASWAQGQIVVIQGTDTLAASRTTINSNFSYLDTGKAGKFSGSGVPGSITLSRLGDLYSDTTAGDTYQCFKPSGACTSVAAANWIKVNTAAGLGFALISSGTNTTAAMIISTGASLTVGGSGTINATSLGGVVAVSYVTLTGSQTLTNKSISGGQISSAVATATALATARAIYGNSFDGTAALTQVIASTFGGTGNGFFKISGPASSEKTWTIPNQSINWTSLSGVVVLTSGVPSVVSGTSTNCVLVDGTSTSCGTGLTQGPGISIVGSTIAIDSTYAAALGLAQSFTAKHLFVVTGGIPALGFTESAVPITTLTAGSMYGDSTLHLPGYYHSGASAFLLLTGFVAGVTPCTSSQLLVGATVGLNCATTLPSGLNLPAPVLNTPASLNCANCTNVPLSSLSAGTLSTQTDAATVTWAIGSVLNAFAKLTFTVHSGSRTLVVTDPLINGNYQIIVKQDSTGGEGLTLGACGVGAFKIIGGGAGAVTPSTGANAEDLLAFTYDGANCYGTFGKNYN